MQSPSKKLPFPPRSRHKRQEAGRANKVDPLDTPRCFKEDFIGMPVSTQCKNTTFTNNKSILLDSALMLCFSHLCTRFAFPHLPGISTWLDRGRAAALGFGSWLPWWIKHQPMHSTFPYCHATWRCCRTSSCVESSLTTSRYCPCEKVDHFIRLKIMSFQPSVEKRPKTRLKGDLKIRPAFRGVTTVIRSVPWHSLTSNFFTWF